MTTTLLCLLSFGLSLAIDFFYAEWLLALNDKRALAAMLHSAVCSLLGSISLLVVVDCWPTIFTAALGHALGSGLALGMDARMRELEKKWDDYEQLDRPDRPDSGIPEEI